jgi:N-methylhydantoinase B
MGLNMKSGGSKGSPLLLVSQHNFKPSLRSGKTLDEEGVRIPPTPIRQKGQVNEAILGAIDAHPLAPKNFRQQVEEKLGQLNRVHKVCRELSQRAGLDWSKQNLRAYIRSAQKGAERIMGELANGEHREDLKLRSGHLLRLRTEITPEKTIFDFSGTETPAEFALTDSATFGACVGALLSQIGKNLPLNAGVLSRIDLVAPKGSMVNAKFPPPTFVGMTDGTSIVANQVIRCLGEIDSGHLKAMSSTTKCAFDLEFAEGLKFYETLESGSAASATSSGLDGATLWQRHRRSPSLEEIESLYPLKVKTYSFRPNSGGVGRMSGGDGVTKSLELLEPALLRWHIHEPVPRPEGRQGGRAASAPEIVVVRAGSKTREKLGLEGELPLASGDSITLHSAGGGGFGEA